MKSSVKYGIITGCIIGIFTMTFFSLFDWLNTKFNMGMRPSNIRGITGLLTIIIQAIGIYTGIKAVKTSQNNMLNYWQGVKTGVFIAIITAIITSISSFLYCTVINPNYANYMVSIAEKEMIAAGETKDQISAHLVDVRKTFSTATQVGMAFVGQLVIGTAISFILSPFIQTKKLKTV